MCVHVIIYRRDVVPRRRSLSTVSDVFSIQYFHTTHALYGGEGGHDELAGAARRGASVSLPHSVPRARPITTGITLYLRWITRNSILSVKIENSAGARVPRRDNGNNTDKKNLTASNRKIKTPKLPNNTLEIFYCIISVDIYLLFFFFSLRPRRIIFYYNV